MEFTITITGAGSELGGALRAVKTALEGHELSGSVSTTVENQPAASVPSQQTWQPDYGTERQQAYQQPLNPQPGQSPTYPDQSLYQQQQSFPPQQPAQQPMYPPAGAPMPLSSPAPAGAVPTEGQSFTMDQLAVAATQLMDAGRRQEVVNLLNQFGAQALTALPKEHYGGFATSLRAMGAKI